jgi:tuberous sclerosis 2
MDQTSERLASYDPESHGGRTILPVSLYLSAILSIIQRETDWEILSYVLCHLPVQLGNKHLFCGPNSRSIVSEILTALCKGITDRSLGMAVHTWPPGLKAGDAQGLAYHTLSILISYRRCFSTNQQHMLVEVLQSGLTVTGQLSTIKCCLHALSLAAFELLPSMTRHLTQILEKLSQIMSNPEMPVHIINFLSIVGSLPSLHANFTFEDFRLVFGVALQYLQNHNPKADSVLTISWALAQHLRIMSYYLVYLWFLNVNLPDRPQHIRYITRQLLLANQGNEEIDASTEVAFDWLARYAYASADPRPARSVLSDMVMGYENSGDQNLPEKSWLLGYSVVTVRALPKRGWIEVEARRPSGYTKFICRAENVPMVGPGEVDPDMVSLPAGLMMNRDLHLPPAPNPDQQAPEEASARGVS